MGGKGFYGVHDKGDLSFGVGSITMCQAGSPITCVPQDHNVTCVASSEPRMEMEPPEAGGLGGGPPWTVAAILTAPGPPLKLPREPPRRALDAESPFAGCSYPPEHS